jgi:hypothetical protein
LTDWQHLDHAALVIQPNDAALTERLFEKTIDESTILNGPTFLVGLGIGVGVEAKTFKSPMLDLIFVAERPTLLIFGVNDEGKNILKEGVDSGKIKQILEDALNEKDFEESVLHVIDGNDSFSLYRLNSKWNWAEISTKMVWTSQRDCLWPLSLISALRQSVEIGDIYATSSLIQNSLFNPVDSVMALREAASNRYSDIISLLLHDPRFDPNAKDKDGKTGKKKNIENDMNTCFFWHLFSPLQQKYFTMPLQLEI